MSAQERRVVHERLKERAGIETYSEGDEPNRCVDRRSPRRGVSPDPTAALDPAGREALGKVLELLAEERASVSSVVDERAWKVHVADSLTGLEVPRAARPRRGSPTSAPVPASPASPSPSPSPTPRST